jgi:hypothetical protein
MVRSEEKHVKPGRERKSSGIRNLEVIPLVPVRPAQDYCVGEQSCATVDTTHRRQRAANGKWKAVYRAHEQRCS